MTGGENEVREKEEEEEWEKEIKIFRLRSLFSLDLGILL